MCLAVKCCGERNGRAKVVIVNVRESVSYKVLTPRRWLSCLRVATGPLLWKEHCRMSSATCHVRAQRCAAVPASGAVWNRFRYDVPSISSPLIFRDAEELKHQSSLEVRLTLLVKKAGSIPATPLHDAHWLRIFYRDTNKRFTVLRLTFANTTEQSERLTPSLRHGKFGA